MRDIYINSEIAWCSSLWSRRLVTLKVTVACMWVRAHILGVAAEAVGSLVTTFDDVAWVLQYIHSGLDPACLKHFLVLQPQSFSISDNTEHTETASTHDPAIVSLKHLATARAPKKCQAHC